MNQKITAALFITLMISTAAADMKFRSSKPIDVYSQFNMHNNTLTNLPSPSADSDALNLGYANSQYLQRSGDSLNGNLDMGGNKILNLPTPTDPNEPATKSYVDNQLAYSTGSQNLSQVLNEGATANQTINMKNNKITSLAAPSSSQDALTLGFANSMYLQRNGDSLNGNLDLNGNKLLNTDKITGNNTENSINFTSNGVLITQGTNTVLNITDRSNLKIKGRINMKNSKITGLSTPENPSDAVTLQYFNQNDASGTDNQTISFQNQKLKIQNGNGEFIEYANNTDTIDGLQPSELSWSQLGIQKTDLKISNLGAADSSLDMNGHSITNLGTPSTSGDAVTLGFANSQYLKRDTSDSMNGTLDMLNHEIVNLQDPDNPQDAANRKWVENYVSGSIQADTNASTACGTGKVLNGDGNCVTRYSSRDDGDTSSTNEIQNPTVTASGDQITVDLDNGGGSSSASITDNTDDSITDNLGPIDTESEFENQLFNIETPSEDANTNAATQCQSGEYLNGDGTCDTITGGDGYIGNSGTHTAGGTLDMNGNKITSSSNMCIGQYC